MWIETFFNGQWIRYYNQTARHYFAWVDLDIEDVCQQAQEHLLLQLKKMRQQPSDALVKTIFKNALHDQYRKHFGRHRPPKWLAAMGTLWVQVWEWFCLKNIPQNELEGYMPQLAKKQAEQIVLQIKAQQACPKLKAENLPYDETAENIFQEPGLQSNAQPENWLIEMEMKQFIYSLLEQDSERLDVGLIGHHLYQTYHKIQQEIALDSEEVLMLKMRFQEDERIDDIAKALFKPAYQVRRDLKKVLSRINKVLKRFGLQQLHIAVQG